MKDDDWEIRVWDGPRTTTRFVPGWWIIPAFLLGAACWWFMGSFIWNLITG